MKDPVSTDAPYPQEPSDELAGWTREELIGELRSLRLAIDARDQIGQAKGMIRLLAQCGPETAFAVLSKTSQHTNRRLRDVAEVLTGAAATGATMPDDVASAFQREMSAVRAAPEAEREP